MTKVRPDIAVRAVEVDRPDSQGIDWGAPVLKQYNVHSLPSFKIMGPSGKLIADGRDAYLRVYTCLQKELK